MCALQWLTDSFKELMEYYEEDIYKPLEEFFKKHEIWNAVAILALLTLVYMPFLMAKEPSSWHTSEANSTKRHLTQSDLIEYFPKSGKLRSLFNLLGNRIEFPPSQDPLAFVIAGKNLQREELRIKEISNKHFWMDNITIHADGKMTEASLFHDINMELEKHDGKAFVFIDEVDNLSGRAPLVLQTLSDVDASKFKETVYVLTIVDDKMEKALSDKECLELVTRKLEKAWSPSLHHDQLQPIISRITGITICLS